MENTYDSVPNIITEKDLDYLTDMFNWNYGALKNSNSAFDNCKDEEIKTVIGKACDLFDNNMSSVLSILEGGTNE